ncbi:hypothetical protein TCSYLVIO_009274, partial [Trypanosoma cruzi]
CAYILGKTLRRTHCLSIYRLFSCPFWMISESGQRPRR